MNEIEFWKIETVQKDGKRFSEQYAGRKSEAIERVKFNLRLRFVDYCILFKKTETRMHGEKHKGYEQVGRYVYSDFVVKPPEWLLDCIPKELDCIPKELDCIPKELDCIPKELDCIQKETDNGK